MAKDRDENELEVSVFSNGEQVCIKFNQEVDEIWLDVKDARHMAKALRQAAKHEPVTLEHSYK